MVRVRARVSIRAWVRVRVRRVRLWVRVGEVPSNSSTMDGRSV